MSRHFSPYFDFRAGDGIQEGKQTKGNINRRGYNKFLTMEGDVKVSIDYGLLEKNADKIPFNLLGILEMEPNSF